MANADRSEKPTQKKRREAREKGQVPRSKEVTAALTFLILIIYLSFTQDFLARQMKDLFETFWRSFLTRDLTVQESHELILTVFWSVIKLAGFPLALTVTAILGGTFLQGGLVFSAEKLKFKVEKFNPAQNLKKVFSKRGVVELGKTLALVAILVYLTADVIWSRAGFLERMVVLDPRFILTSLVGIVIDVGWRVGLFLVVVALADYAFQWYRHEEELKQTKQEVKEDLKETEGNPLVKGRIRRLQRDMANKRMMAAVQDADVVVTNPTHYAVALKYSMEEMSAPQVVAKGAGFVARKIKELAEKHEVPMFENVALAQTLYKSVEVGQEVPANLYRAVAQILAHVYRIRKEKQY